MEVVWKYWIVWFGFLENVIKIIGLFYLLLLYEFGSIFVLLVIILEEGISGGRVLFGYSFVRIEFSVNSKRKKERKSFRGLFVFFL